MTRTISPVAAVGAAARGRAARRAGAAAAGAGAPGFGGAAAGAGTPCCAVLPLRAAAGGRFSFSQASHSMRSEKLKMTSRMSRWVSIGVHGCHGARYSRHRVVAARVPGAAAAHAPRARASRRAGAVALERFLRVLASSSGRSGSCRRQQRAHAPAVAAIKARKRSASSRALMSERLDISRASPGIVAPEAFTQAAHEQSSGPSRSCSSRKASRMQRLMRLRVDGARRVTLAGRSACRAARLRDASRQRDGVAGPGCAARRAAAGRVELRRLAAAARAAASPKRLPAAATDPRRRGPWRARADHRASAAGAAAHEKTVAPRRRRLEGW